MKRYIYSMAVSRKDIAADIEQGCKQLILHLIKLQLYPDNININHWRREVANKLNEVDMVKGKHKFPSPEFIMKNSWEIYKPYIPTYIQKIIKSYGQPSYSYDELLLTNKIRRYFEWLANELHQNGFVVYEEIYEYLQKHGF